jgi:hypothetical protein
MNRCWERSSRARAVMIFDHARVNPVREVQSISAKHLSMPVSHPQKRGGHKVVYIKASFAGTLQ